MIDDSTDQPFYPYLLAPEVEREGEMGGDEPLIATRSSVVVPDPEPSFASTVADDVAVLYVAWERDRVVLGWLWWDDASGASWHVPNVFEEGAREADGRTLTAVHPWVHQLAAAFHEQQTPSAAIQRLLSDQPDADGNLIPVQAPMRARSLRHLEQIAGLDDYRAAEASWRNARRPAAASIPPASAADPGPAAPAAPAAPAGPAAPAAADAVATRRRRRFPFFWRRG